MLTTATNPITEDVFFNSACLFKGIPTLPRNYEDVDYMPDQESTFWYFFGIKEPDCFAVITPSKEKNEDGLYKNTTTLFVPRYE